jgi:hypothetical protein
MATVCVFFVGVHLREGEACVVVNGHEQHLPARAVDRVTTVAVDAVAGAFYARPRWR